MHSKKNIDRFVTLNILDIVYWILSTNKSGKCFI